MKYEFDTDLMSKYELSHLRAILNCRQIILKPEPLNVRFRPLEHGYRVQLGVEYRVEDRARRKRLDDFIQKNYPKAEWVEGEPIEIRLSHYTAPVVYSGSGGSYSLYLKDARSIGGLLQFLEKEEFQPDLIHVFEDVPMDEIRKETIQEKLERFTAEFDEKYKVVRKAGPHQRGYG